MGFGYSVGDFFTVVQFASSVSHFRHSEAGRWRFTSLTSRRTTRTDETNDL
jgi:hypothetical protein